MIKIVIIEESNLIREGLKAIVTKDSGMEVVAESNNVYHLESLCATYKPNVVLLNIDNDSINKLEIARELLLSNTEYKVIALTGTDGSRYLNRIIGYRFSGYLHKESSSEDIINSIIDVNLGEVSLYPEATRNLIESFLIKKDRHVENPLYDYYLKEEKDMLSHRELQVLQLITDGCNNKEVGRKLLISDKTVKNHVSSILKKLNTQDRTHSVVTGLKLGLVELK